MRWLAGACLVVLVALCLACGGGPISKAKAIPREEFKAKVMGKTEAEVIEAVGKPDKTQEGSYKTWYYDRRTYDPVTGKVDYSAQVNFSRGGRVERINF